MYDINVEVFDLSEWYEHLRREAISSRVNRSAWRELITLFCDSGHFWLLPSTEVVKKFETAWPDALNLGRFSENQIQSINMRLPG